MTKTKRILGIAGLSAIFATTLSVTIALPIGLANNKNNQNAKYFEGLSKNTNYLVGDNIKLRVNNVTNPDQYDFLWFIKLENQDQIKPLEGYQGQSIDLTNAQLAWNQATVYCALTKKAPVQQNQPSAFLATASSTDNNANSEQKLSTQDVVMWTSTKLELSQAFTISSCSLGVSADSITNGVVEDTKDQVILAPKD